MKNFDKIGVVFVLFCFKMLLKNCFCFIVTLFLKLSLCFPIESLDWICEGTAPCVRVTHPQGGIGEAPASAQTYRISILVHRRKSDPKVQEWWSQKRNPTWNVVISWFRLLNSKDRIPLTSCKNNLACTVSLIGRDETQGGQMGTSRHFLVEVKFEGHSSTSKVEVIIHKPHASHDHGYSGVQQPPLQLQDAANYDLSSHEHSDYGVNRDAGLQDYVDQMQYRQDSRQHNSIHRGARLGVLPKMIADQIDYDRFGEDRYLKEKQQLSMISGSRDESEYEDYGDLSVMQSAYEDEILGNNDAGGGMGQTGKVFLSLGILLILGLIFGFLCKKYRKRMKKVIKRGIRFSSNEENGSKKRERASFFKKYREKLKGNRKGKSPHPSSGNVMSKNVHSCSYSRLSISSDLSCSDEEELLFSQIPSKSKGYAAWKDVKEKSRNLANQARNSFTVSARKAASTTPKIFSQWGQSDGFCYNCFAMIQRCFASFYAALHKFMQQYCSPCYFCCAYVGNWLYQCCVTTSENVEFQKPSPVFDNFTSDTSFEPLPTKPSKLAIHKDSRDMTKEKLSTTFFPEPSRENNGVRKSSTHRANGQRGSSSYYDPGFRKVSEFSDDSDEDFEPVPSNKKRKSSSKKHSQVSNKFYQDAKDNQRKDSYDDYVAGRERQSKFSNKRSRATVEDDFHTPNAHSASNHHRISGDSNKFTLASDKNRFSENYTDARDQPRHSYMSYDEFHDFEAASPRAMHKGKHIPHPSGGKTILHQPTFSPKQDISGRFLIFPLGPRRNVEMIRKDQCATKRLKRCGVGLPQSTLIPGPSCQLPHIPKRKCGLHCIQTQHEKYNTPNICKDEPLLFKRFSSALSCRSSCHPSTTASATSLPNNVQPVTKENQKEEKKQQEISSSTSKCPSLTKTLLKTKEGFHRENQRIEALIKRYEKKAPSCIVTGETVSEENHRKSRYFQLRNQQFTSDINSTRYNLNSSAHAGISRQHEKPFIKKLSEKRPPRLLVRRPRLSPKKVLENGANIQTQKQDGSLPNRKVIDQQYNQSTVPSKVNSDNLSVTKALHAPQSLSNFVPTKIYSSLSSVHTSEIDDVISDESLSFPTSQIEFSSSTDESNKIKRRLSVVPAPSCGNDISAAATQDDRLCLNSKISKKIFTNSKKETVEDSLSNLYESPAEVLNSAAAAFFSSEDEIPSHDDEYCYQQFWPHG